MTQVLRRVAQREYKKGDCGLACVATITGTSYLRVLEEFRRLPKRRNDEEFYTTHSELQAMLRKLGWRSRRRQFAGFRNLVGHAIVKVNPRKDRTWHWVVFDGGRGVPTVHDPKPGKRRLIRDFRGIRGHGQYVSCNA